MTFILENSFKPEAGARPDLPKIGILITDGKSQDDVIPPAKSLRDAGIELFAIGKLCFFIHSFMIYIIKNEQKMHFGLFKVFQVH